MADKDFDEIVNGPIDPKQQAEGQRRRELEYDALRQVLRTRAGRRFIWNLMGRCGMHQNPFGMNNDVTNFNCGRLSVATDLRVDMEAINGDAYTLMSKESKEDEAYVNGTNTAEPDASNNDAPGGSTSGEYNPLT